MAQYSKAIAAAVGLAMILAKDVFGLTIPGDAADKITEGILALGTVFAVFQVQNKT